MGTGAAAARHVAVAAWPPTPKARRVEPRYWFAPTCDGPKEGRGEWFVQDYVYMNWPLNLQGEMRLAWRVESDTLIHTAVNYRKVHGKWSGWHGRFVVESDPQYGVIVEFDYAGRTWILKHFKKHTGLWQRETRTVGYDLEGEDYRDRLVSVAANGPIYWLHPRPFAPVPVVLGGACP